MRPTFRTMLLGWGFAVMLSSCTLVVGDQVDRLSTDSRPDLRYTLRDFDPHVGQLTELRLVSDAGLIQARAIYDPLPSPRVEIVLLNVVQENVRRVDFYSDLNGNRIPDPSELEMNGERFFPDHMWRDEVDQDGVGSFSHSFDFRDILADEPAQSVGRPLVLRLRDVDGVAAGVIEAWIVGPSDRDVGYYHLSNPDLLRANPMQIEIPGIIDSGTTYTVVVAAAGTTLGCATAAGVSTGLDLELTPEDLAPCGP
jgi:hypothetical protein